MLARCSVCQKAGMNPANMRGGQHHLVFCLALAQVATASCEKAGMNPANMRGGQQYLVFCLVLAQIATASQVQPVNKCDIPTVNTHFWLKALLLAMFFRSRSVLVCGKFLHHASICAFA